jgi:hypothetical protein
VIDHHILLEWIRNCCVRPYHQFYSAISWQKQVIFRCDIVCFANSLWQQSPGKLIPLRHIIQQSPGKLIPLRHIIQQSPGKLIPLRHIILIPNKPICVLIPLWYVVSGDIAYAICNVFGLTRPVREPTIYRTRHILLVLLCFLYIWWQKTLIIPQETRSDTNVITQTTKTNALKTV